MNSQRHSFQHCKTHSNQLNRFVDIQSQELFCDRCLIQILKQDKEKKSFLILDQIISEETTTKPKIIDNWPPLKDDKIIETISSMLEEGSDVKVNLLKKVEDQFIKTKDKLLQNLEGIYKTIIKNINILDEGYIQAIYDRYSEKERLTNSLDQFINNQDKTSFSSLVDEKTKNTDQASIILSYAIDQFNQSKQYPNIIEKMGEKLTALLEEIKHKHIEEFTDLSSCSEKELLQQIFLSESNTLLKQIAPSCKFKWKTIDEVFNGVYISQSDKPKGISNSNQNSFFGGVSQNGNSESQNQGGGIFGGGMFGARQAGIHESQSQNGFGGNINARSLFGATINPNNQFGGGFGNNGASVSGLAFSSSTQPQNIQNDLFNDIPQNSLLSQYEILFTQGYQLQIANDSQNQLQNDNNKWWILYKEQDGMKEQYYKSSSKSFFKMRNEKQQNKIKKTQPNGKLPPQEQFSAIINKIKDIFKKKIELQQKINSQINK